MEARLALVVQQRDEAAVEDAALGDGLLQRLHVDLVAHVPDTGNAFLGVEHRFIAGEEGVAEDIHLSVEGLARADRLDGLAVGVEYRADGALAVAFFHVGADAHKLFAGL